MDSPSQGDDLVPVQSGPTPVQELTPIGRISLDRHPAAIYLARLSPGSRATMRHSLGVVAKVLSGGGCDIETMPWHLIRYHHTQALRAVLASRYSPRNACKILASVRGVLKECWRLGLMDAETYHRAGDVERVKGESLPAGRALTADELAALFRVCMAGQGASAPRDAALLAVLFGSGLRRAEVVALDLADFDGETGALTVQHGKGNKARTVYVAGAALIALTSWIDVRGPDAGALFHPVTRGGHILHRRMTPPAVLARLCTLAKRAGVAHFSPHDARRTFISTMLDAGADIVTVQQLAGHANVQTTAGYDRRGEESKRRAVGLLHLPYTPTPGGAPKSTTNAGTSPEDSEKRTSSSEQQSE